MRVLLVDDEEVIHNTLGVYLADCGMEVESAVNGVSAMEAVENSIHDLVIADMRMPRLDGLALLKKLLDKRPELPVVMISGHGDEDMKDQAENAGARAFLTKPFKLRQVRELVFDLTS